MLGTTLPYYGFHVAAVKTERDEYAVPTQADIITLTLKSMVSTVDVNIDPDKLLRDMAIMNEVRSSSDPAVREAYEQLLTVMALTKGREVPDYGEDELKLAK